MNESFNIKFIIIETTFNVIKNDVSLIASIQKFIKIVDNNKFLFNSVTDNEHTIFKNHEIKFKCDHNKENDKIVFFYRDKH